MGIGQKARQLAVIEIEKNIQMLSSGEIEYVGHGLVSILEGRPLLHRGLNLQGRPTGYTVDTFSMDRTVVSEYSVADGYFSEPYDKIEKDCSHAITEAPALKKLYLVSSQPCPNSVWPEVTKTVQGLVGPDVGFEVFDSRRLAETIFDKIVVHNNQIEYFGDHLPDLVKAWAENVITQAAPNLPSNLVQDESRLAHLDVLVQSTQLAVVYGMSGIGKTYSVIDYVHKNAEHYASIYWISGQEAALTANLSAVRIERLGITLNLGFSLKNSPCLLVIDDWSGDFDVLAAMIPSDVHPGTKVVVTSIQAPPKGFKGAELPRLSDSSAMKLLSLRMATPPTADHCAALCMAVDYHPLTLAVIRDTVGETGISWDEIIRDINNIPNYEGLNRETVLNRILLRHSEGLAAELSALKWLDVQAIDSVLALSIFGPSGISKLMRRSFVRKDENGLLRLHSLVFGCIRTFRPAGDFREAERLLWEFFSQGWNGNNYHFRRSIEIHAVKICDRVIADDLTPSLPTYLYLLLDRFEPTTHVLERLAAEDFSKVLNNAAACLCIVEAIEKLYIRTKAREQRREILVKGIEKIDHVLPLVETGSVHRSLLHHRGKMKFWSGQYAEALVDFEEVLRLYPEAMESRLQIARLVIRENPTRAAKEISQILNGFRESAERCQITVVLAAFAELAKSSLKELQKIWLEEDVTYFRDAISLAAAEGFSQPYRTLGKTARYVYYNNPKVLVDLGRTVSFPLVEDADYKDLFDLGEACKSIGKANMEQYGDSFAMRKWLEQALTYYNWLDNLKSFEITMIAECLHLLGRFGDAISTLDRCEEAYRVDHWWHRRAQSLMEFGDLGAATAAIDKALELLKKPLYRSAFLQTKTLIQEKNGEKACLATVQSAIDGCEPGKFKQELMKLKESLTAKFGGD